ncbi:STAS domain-containing protein [Antrihabitans stalactiti]|uniref:STAS domain-containing protein n=1 Tax=Antrihabitans stalactiti TaxID=2584121 RepID=UPI00146B4654
MLDLIVLSGELDLLTCPALLVKLQARARAGRQLVLDLSEVSFFGATAMALVEQVQLESIVAGGSVRLVGVPRQIMRVMTMIGFDKVVPISSSGGEQLLDFDRSASVYL